MIINGSGLPTSHSLEDWYRHLLKTVRGLLNKYQLLSFPSKYPQSRNWRRNKEFYICKPLWYLPQSHIAEEVQLPQTQKVA